MGHSRKHILVLLVSVMAAASAELAHAEPVEKITTCNMESIQASFKAALSSYRVEAGCATKSITKSGGRYYRHHHDSLALVLSRLLRSTKTFRKRGCQCFWIFRLRNRHDHTILSD